MLWYYGLPSRPKLVARTSNSAWRREFEDGWEVRKCLRPVGAHPMVAKYTDDVAMEIIRSLGDLPWNTVDVVRIGQKYTSKKSEFPVILWISVEPASTSWKIAYKHAADCVAILNQHLIYDVECEIREAAVVPLAESRLLSLNHDDPCSMEKLPFTQVLGQSCATIHNETREGTLGLYLQRKQDGQPFALTNRHVVLECEQELSSNSQHCPKVIQPGSNTLKNVCEALEENIEEYEKLCKITEGLPRYQELLEQFKAELGLAQSFQEPQHRIIGHVCLSSPHLGGENIHSQEKWFRDWALIELNPWKYTNFSSLQNAVYIEKWPRELRDYLAKDERAQQYWRYNHNVGLRPLKGVVSVDELQAPPMRDPDDNPCLIVLMVGRTTTKATVGYTNSIASQVRRPSTYDIHSKELIVIPAGEEAVSKPGDSGSALFDVYGRVCGLVSAGLGSPLGRLDVTYATPMEWVLKDVSAELGEEVELLEEKEIDAKTLKATGTVATSS